ncbi:MAG TPA: nicotinate phosphoribosyltransferase [Terriglobales bacterium]|nr:nicotinate phosphoribosyltransferase [Terriglobales bacterium]
MTFNPHSLLLTDLYELTMAAAFFENHYNPTATFELFVRRFPENRNFLITAGLEQALDWVESICCGEMDVDYLRKHPAFGHISKDFFDYLCNFRFSGEIWAIPEGTVVFPNEPLLRVTAPLIEAQVLETYLLAAITYQTTVASKAARVMLAAEGKDVVEFGSRRAHGPEAGLLAARAAYIAGCAGTSNVEAGRRFGIPTSGTIAHSYVMAFDDEVEAFKSYSKLFPEASILLVDTYDTLQAVDKIIAAGLRPQGIRLDSGDLAELSRAARQKLDAAGLQRTKILASGDLNETSIVELTRRGAKIDAYGVGTELVVSRDAPALSGVYKLVEIERDGKTTYQAKFSPDKMTHPGAKQVWRFRNSDGKFARDLIACAGEKVENAEPLLVKVMSDGKRTSQESLDQIRGRARQQIRDLPERLLTLDHEETYEVEYSQGLERLLEEVRQQHQFQ